MALASRSGVGGVYKYSHMAGTRDFEMEVHFDIQAGLAVYTFVTFLFSDLDLPPGETTLRGSLRPMDGSELIAMMSMVGR